ncbi:MAG TPA: Ig-like domain-containing protein [Kofleriaceae bacterium]|jgi:hypothetical protein
MGARLWLVATAAVTFSSIGAASADSRALCNGSRFRCYSYAQTDEHGFRRNTPSPQGYGADDIEDAYHVDTTAQASATIGIIGAYNYPTLEADLAAYRAQYGLPACTVASGCLTIVNEQGQTSPLPGNAPAGDDWNGETALDVDMASAGCPSCKILVVLATDDMGDGLLVANNTAASLHATVVSNSWGGGESEDQDAYVNHPGIAYFASTGDRGNQSHGASFPASSAYVVAVGGTSLARDSSLRGWKEIAWSGAGSACSHVFARPAWQTNSVCAMRATADVSAIGDPETGVAVYEDGTWGIVGGTSASSPLVAAIFAQTGHTDVTGQFAYEHPEAFNDVTSGSNGTCTGALCDAGTGWDGPTGVGTPNGPVLAGAMAPTVSLSPATGATVPRGFTVTVTCMPNDAAAVQAVNVMIDGEMFPAITAAPYTLVVPSTIANGSHTISASCTMSSLAAASASATVRQVDPCSSATDCPNATDVCFDDACIAGPDAANGLGATCTGNGDCASGECAADGADKKCTMSCGAEMSCPDGFECLEAGTASVCWPGTSGGGCDTSSSSSSSGALLLCAFAFAAVLGIRRRA